MIQMRTPTGIRFFHLGHDSGRRSKKTRIRFHNGQRRFRLFRTYQYILLGHLQCIQWQFLLNADHVFFDSSLSSDDEDVRILRRLERRSEDPPESSPSTSQDFRKRPRPRSRSITPPPALPQHTLWTAKQKIRYVFPSLAI